jgi:hypothetical protein
MMCGALDWVMSRYADASGRTAPRGLIHLFNSVREQEVARVERGEPRFCAASKAVTSGGDQGQPLIGAGGLSFFAAYCSVKRVKKALNLDELYACPFGLVAIEGSGKHLCVCVTIFNHAITRFF